MSERLVDQVRYHLEQCDPESVADAQLQKGLEKVLEWMEAHDRDEFNKIFPHTW